jgi:hypothetical protein
MSRSSPVRILLLPSEALSKIYHPSSRNSSIELCMMSEEGPGGGAASKPDTAGASSDVADIPGRFDQQHVKIVVVNLCGFLFAQTKNRKQQPRGWHMTLSARPKPSMWVCSTSVPRSVLLSKPTRKWGGVRESGAGVETDSVLFVVDGGRRLTMVVGVPAVVRLSERGHSLLVSAMGMGC